MMPEPIKKANSLKDKYIKVNDAVANLPLYKFVVFDHEFFDYQIPENKQLCYL